MGDTLPMTLRVSVTLTEAETALEELNVSVLLGVADTTGESVKRVVTVSFPLLLTVGVGELDATKEYVTAPVPDTLFVKDVVLQPLTEAVFVELCIAETLA